MYNIQKRNRTSEDTKSWLERCILCMETSIDMILYIEMMKENQRLLDPKRVLLEGQLDMNIANSSGTFGGVNKHRTATDKRIQSESEERYRAIIARYKRLITEEKKSLCKRVFRI